MLKKVKYEIKFIIIAVTIGITVGYLALSYARIIRFLSSAIYLNLAENMRLLIILIPAVGGLFVGLLIHFGSLTARGHGIPAILETVKSKKRRLSYKDLLIEGFASAITIGTGGSAGRIGPVVEIGAGIGDIIGYKLNLPLELYQTILGCGAAAGIAGIFNSPLGGIIFAVEIIFKEIKIKRLTLIVISALSSDAFVRLIAGNEPLFYYPAFTINSPLEYPLYFILGIITGLISYIFIRVLYNISIYSEKLSIPYWLKPTLGGLVVGMVGYFIPEIMGTGISTINRVLTNKYLIVFLLLLLILKIFVTGITLGSGGSGGIFAPALMMGAVCGVMYGEVIHKYIPVIVKTPESYGLVAMAALISGLLHAPLTGVIIIFEITNNYSLIIPLLLASIISTIISDLLNPESIYSPKLFERL